MSRMTDDQWTTIAAAFRSELQRVVPEWTDHNDADPGITLLELFAFLTEQLIYRTTPVRANRFAADAIRALTTLQSEDTATSDGLVRNRYFEGKLLTADNLQLEQDYNRAKLRRHNRALHRAGIVTGLKVTVDGASTSDEPVVKISAGYAIASNGEELSLPSAGVFRLCATAPVGVVTLEYAERFLDPTSDIILDNERPTRIQEFVRVSFAEHAPPNAVVLARLKRRGSVWKLTGVSPTHRAFMAASHR